MAVFMDFPLSTGTVSCFNSKCPSTTVLFDYRSGNMTFGFENGSIVVGAQAATQRLRGHFTWQLEFRLYSPRGRFSLEIDHLDIQIGLKQPINVQKKPRLEVLKVSLGNIQVLLGLKKKKPETI